MKTDMKILQKWLKKSAFAKYVVKDNSQAGYLIEFANFYYKIKSDYDMKLLQDLADLKSDTATEKNSKEYKKTMSEVYVLLNWYESIK